MSGALKETSIGITIFEYFASAVYFVELNSRMFVYMYKFGNGTPGILLRKFVWDIYNIVDIAVVLIDVVRA
jgi:hypothetical protein